MHDVCVYCDHHVYKDGRHKAFEAWDERTMFAMDGKTSVRRVWHIRCASA